MKKTNQFGWKKITYCQILNFSFLMHNIFPCVSVCQNSDEIEATDPHNIRILFVCLFVFLGGPFLFLFLFCKFVYIYR